MLVCFQTLCFSRREDEAAASSSVIKQRSFSSANDSVVVRRENKSSKGAEEAAAMATVAASRAAAAAAATLTNAPAATNNNVLANNNDNNNMQNLLLVREERIKELELQLRARDEEIQSLRSHLDKFQSVFPFHAGSAVTTRPRKQQRAQGISAEPQSHSTIQELSKQKFPIYPKNDR